MGQEQLAVFRGRPEPRTPRSPNTTTSPRLGDESLPRHPLSILARAASVRLDDPRDEHERVVMLEVAIIAGREAARTLDRWLSQSLAEYRGSRTTWDLTATTAQLRLELDQFEKLLRETAQRLMALIPGLMDAAPGSALPSVSRSHRRCVVDEVAAVSNLLRAIEPRAITATGP